MKPAPRRRNRSRPRERILQWIRASDAHPSAAAVFEGLRPELPRLSLGTVYRNLGLLVAEGRLEEVAAPGGVRRYDGNPEPHHHFVCEACGGIRDIRLPLPEGLGRRLRRRYRLRAERAHLDFFGLCEECAERAKTEQHQRRAQRCPRSREPRPIRT